MEGKGFYLSPEYHYTTVLDLGAEVGVGRGKDALKHATQNITGPREVQNVTVLFKSRNF